MPKASPPPLDGITVVAVEQAVAAPLATRNLADLGARVLKVERPDGGDFARGYDGAVGGWSSFFVWLNRGKESVVLDLKSPEGTDVLARLLDRADVFVHNLAPGAVERLGFGRAAIAERWPSLVTASLTGYGSKGPWRSKKAYDFLVQAESGLLSISGGPEGMARSPVSVADIAAGTQLLTGILAALYLRQRTGQVVPVEVALFDSMVEWLGAPLAFTTGSGAPPPRTGTHHATIAPYGVYQAADGGAVLLAVQNEREWRALCADVLGRADLPDDPRFCSNTARVAHRQDLDKILDEHCRSLSADELADELERAGVATGRVSSLADLPRHPVLQERHRWTVADVDGRLVDVVRPPLDSGGFPMSHRPAVVPTLGQHTEEVLRELGLAPASAPAPGAHPKG